MLIINNLAFCFGKLLFCDSFKDFQQINIIKLLQDAYFFKLLHIMSLYARIT